MNKYEIRTKQKKDAILNAALDLFQEKGYTNVSINEIAEKSGVSTVSIYNYFHNKEGLVLESTRILMEETTLKVTELLSGEGGFKDKLLKAVSLCTEQPQQLLKKQFSIEALNDQTFIGLFKESTDKIRQEAFENFIECGKKEGAIAPSISTALILEFLTAAGSITANWKTKEDYLTKSNDLYQLVLYGLIGKAN